MAWGFAIDEIQSDKDYEAYLLVLDINQASLVVRPFRKQELDLAETELLKIEMEKKGTVDAVLVSVESIANLRKAYPNYYGDTTIFVQFCRDVLDGNLSLADEPPSLDERQQELNFGNSSSVGLGPR